MRTGAPVRESPTAGDNCRPRRQLSGQPLVNLRFGVPCCRLALSNISSRSWRPLAPAGVAGRHVKEGVDGSSPSEGFPKLPAKCPLELLQWETAVTRGRSRALSGVPSLDTPQHRIRLVQADPNPPDPLCINVGHTTCDVPALALATASRTLQKSASRGFCVTPTSAPPVTGRVDALCALAAADR